MTLAGCDVSEHQGGLDWPTIRRVVDFALIRTSFGVAPGGRADVRAAVNLAGARAAGLLVGGYHYCYPQFNSPESEARFAWGVYHPLPGEPFAFDFEERHPDPVGWLAAACGAWRMLSGYPPLVYLNRSLKAAHDWGPVIAQNVGLWLAVLDAGPYTAAPWPFVAIEQVNQGPLGGIGGQVFDRDLFFGDRAAWGRYGGSGAGPAPPVPTPPPPPAPPPPRWQQYQVRAGDSMSAIAARLGVRLGLLEAWNPQLRRGGHNWNLIYPWVDRVWYLR